MKFNVAAAAASAVFLVGGVAADDQKVLKDESSVVESATQAAPELPTFTVSIHLPIFNPEAQPCRALARRRKAHDSMANHWTAY
jgi:hypothetical protein